MEALGQIAHIRAGHAFRSKLTNDPSSGSGVLQMKDIDDARGVDWAHVLRCEPVAISREWLAAGDILLVARGARNQAYFIEDEPPFPTLAAPHFFHISLYPDAAQHLLPAFLGWQLNQQPVQDYFKRNAEGSTSKSVRRAVVENTPLFIPTLEEQQAVIGLQRAIKRERLLAEALVANGEKLMAQICMDLMNKSKGTQHGDSNE